jgi:hypothetical protein
MHALTFIHGFADCRKLHPEIALRVMRNLSARLAWRLIQCQGRSAQRLLDIEKRKMPRVESMALSIALALAKFPHCARMQPEPGSLPMSFASSRTIISERRVA